ncbi:ligand-binding protein SH3 [Thermococcus sp. GR7]|uniref:COG2426 family protein n=1 Tax=unclassified Thermococcus TaxID=2627626 RepID=UPI00143023B5|nr:MULTISPECIES: COG2426 family protein [unclassified Thermococcus]NJE41982.1 ligand-binding protein SH3 [Thermococcus sp. GR6]NJE47653.1 ligand-binding protein SH3 [Thermococcus sp. GR7]NJE78933.1 ligand-binding protein SH3 [Thermococcus sp. GR4]NJF22583.1 ligand-binding protein SH3 [Thermococcus sp. GR5]
MNNLLEVFILSLVPTFEGRYAIVYGISKGYPLWKTLLAASLGVLLLSLVLPAVLPYIDRLMIWLEGTFLRKIAHLYLYYVERVRKKAHPYVEKWGFLGLTIFVAIPLPGTGIWTGALAAYLFGIEKRQTVPALILGGLLSMAITVLPALGLFG